MKHITLILGFTVTLFGQRLETALDEKSGKPMLVGIAVRDDIMKDSYGEWYFLGIHQQNQDWSSIKMLWMTTFTGLITSIDVLEYEVMRPRGTPVILLS